MHLNMMPVMLSLAPAQGNGKPIGV